MASLRQLKNNLDVASEHHKARNYAVCVPLCKALLQNLLPPIMAVECHIMLITARVPEALEHSVSANIIARELLAQFPDNTTFQELYDISQNLLRMVQHQNREERNNASPRQQTLTFASGTTSQPQPGSPDNQSSDTATPSSPLSPSPSSYASSFRGLPISPNPVRRPRHRVSDIYTNLATIAEEAEDELPARSGPSSPVYRNRRPSSLCRAAGNLLRNMGSSQGN